MKDNPILSFQQSNAMKAIAMLLIILGHNHIISSQNGCSSLFEYLYRFHVSIFFFLPFFYGKTDKINKQNISKILIRNGVPYFMIFCFSYIVYNLIIKHNEFNIVNFLGGFTNFPGYDLKSTIGFTFPWFLPVFMLMSIYKIIGNNYKWAKWALFAIGLIICISSKAYIIMRHSPFYILKAIYYYAMGLSMYLLYKNIKHINYLGCIAFIVLSILFWTNVYKANTFYFSLSGFCVIKEITSHINFSRIPFIDLIGKYSLPIYLIHVFISNTLERILPHSFIYGITIYLITIILSIFISITIYKFETVRSFIFPKSWNDWICSFKKK